MKKNKVIGFSLTLLLLSLSFVVAVWPSEGHQYNDLQPCSDGQILVTSGSSWICSAVPESGSGSESPWTESGGVVSYDGNVQVSGSFSGNGASLYRPGSGSPGLEIRSESGGTPYVDFSNDGSADYDMRLILRGDDALSIEGGNVGIGTTNPRSRLSIGGEGNSNFAMYINSSNNNAIVVESSSGVGIVATSESSTGIRGGSISRSGVFGTSNSGYGVQGSTYNGRGGVLGSSNNGDGVTGSSNSGNGVVGSSNNGYAVLSEGLMKIDTNNVAAGSSCSSGQLGAISQCTYSVTSSAPYSTVVDTYTGLCNCVRRSRSVNGAAPTVTYLWKAI